MDADLDTLALALYVRIDDLLKACAERAPARPKVGITPKISDAKLIALAVLQALTGRASPARWLRHAHEPLRHLFPYLPGQPGYNKRLRHLADTLAGPRVIHPLRGAVFNPHWYNKAVQDDPGHPLDDQPPASANVEDSGGQRAGEWATHAAFPGVAAATAAVLEQLHTELGFSWWAVTRITGGTYTVLATNTSGFPLSPGEQLTWADTLCRRVMQEERAPHIVPDVRAVPALAVAPLTEQWPIAAYLSVPLSLDGRELFGTLCAAHPKPLPATLTGRLPLVELQARLLSTVLAAELHVDQARRRAERAEADALLDPLTGLVNRRGWLMLLHREEQRCRRYGTVASVLVVDLDGLKAVNDRHGHAAGDALLQRAAQVLSEAFRSTDVAARLGGDEFAVLAVETDASAAQRELTRLHELFDRAGVPASIGVATRRSNTGLTGAWTESDAQMYQFKRAKTARPSAEPFPA
ncbi:diguanylate cyclase (GGDEF) domain-containing protein [Modestobacter sp. DSM 44400]|uniref:GGDEF domain-containing protein n=1 Tax=Modestobacter sp. DSM 44400 TaxID=1550230 RepID=UPI00089A958F|nr:sensor domain-containing diguanylate cyclase [Modestobacter sp. DSM 44400]SDY98211.1 diguanylate cyclase (GGDEF) domain-containing protein [Modestobacter sp. DSM 44400]